MQEITVLIIKHNAIKVQVTYLVTQPIYWFNGVRPEEVWTLERLAFDGYLQGLHEAGWRGDASLVRLGYTLTVSLCIGMGIFIVEWVARDEKLRHWLEQIMGYPVEEIGSSTSYDKATVGDWPSPLFVC